MSCSPTRLPSLSIRELTIYTKNEQPSPSPTQNISPLSSVTVQCCTVLLAHTRPTVFYIWLVYILKIVISQLASVGLLILAPIVP